MKNRNNYSPLLILLCSLSMVSCGGGGGSGNTPQPSDELAFETGLDGPGDTGNYFPLNQDNLWIIQGTESAAVTTAYQSVYHIRGTKIIDGLLAMIYREANTIDMQVAESWLYKDLNGIANLGSNSLDPMLISLSHYWEVRFPLTAGSAYVQLDRRGLDFAQDLDADGKNETFDIYSTVAVVGFESTSTTLAVYSNALHMKRQTEMTLHMSRNGSVIRANINSDIYNVANIGTVRSETVMTLPGETETLYEELAAYRVDGVQDRLIHITTPLLAKSSSLAGSKDYFLFDVIPGTQYVVSLVGMTGNANLVPLIPVSCSQSYISRDTNLPEECRFTADSDEVLFAVNTLVNSDYIISIAPYATVTDPVDENLLISVDTPTAGQVAPRGSSRYATTGLVMGNHTVSISGLSADADLRVYNDETYSFELDCTLRAPGDIVEQPGDCIVENTDAVYFDVRAGELNTTGASYTILVH